MGTISFSSPKLRLKKNCTSLTSGNSGFSLPSSVSNSSISRSADDSGRFAVIVLANLLGAILVILIFFCFKKAFIFGMLSSTCVVLIITTMGAFGFSFVIIILRLETSAFGPRRSAVRIFVLVLFEGCSDFDRFYLGFRREVWHGRALSCLPWIWFRSFAHVFDFLRHHVSTCVSFFLLTVTYEDVRSLIGSF